MKDIDQQIKCVRREIIMREKVYPRRVYAHQMTREAMDFELDAMRSVLLTLINVRKQTNEREKQLDML